MSLITVDYGTVGGGSDGLKQLYVGTPSSMTIDVGEPFEYLYVSMGYAGYLCACEWDKSDASHWTRYYGQTAAQTYSLPQTSVSGLSSVDPTNGTFTLFTATVYTHLEVFYK